jgi:glucokinase
MMGLRGGLDLGGTKVQAAILDAEGNVLGSARHPTPTTGGPPDVAATLVAALKEAAEAAGTEPAALEGVGVGSPGEIDPDGGTVGNAGNLPNWRAPFPLASVLQEAVGVPVRLGNDVSVATEAEFALGSGRPYRSLLGVFWGTGVGGGLGLRLGEPYVERIRQAMLPHTFADDRPPALHLAALGDLGGAIGAALLVSAPVMSA